MAIDDGTGLPYSGSDPLGAGAPGEGAPGEGALGTCDSEGGAGAASIVELDDVSLEDADTKTRR